MNAKSARKALEKSLISSQANLEMHKQSSQPHPVTRNISRRLPHIPTINNINTERNEAINEIETMNNLLTEMQKESDKKSEMLNSAFDKNFDGKIKTCINTRAEMEARAAAFETIIQSETLIKKPIKDITIENIYEGVFGTNFSQTGSTTDELIMSPMEQQQIILEHTAETNITAPQLTHKIADVISPHTADTTPLNKVTNDQISTKHVKTTGRTKGFSEAALTKVGHWSKSAFKFFRTKNANSDLIGKDTTLLQKNLLKTSHTGNNRIPVRNVQIGGISQENSKRMHWSRKVKPPSQRKIKREKSKKTLQRSAKQKESKKVKPAQKMSVTTELSSTSDALKRHAAKLTEAKKRLKKRNAITSKEKKLDLKTKETLSQKSASYRDLVIDKKEAKDDIQKSKKVVAKLKSEKMHKRINTRKNQEFRN